VLLSFQELLRPANGWTDRTGEYPAKDYLQYGAATNPTKKQLGASERNTVTQGDDPAN